MPGGGQVHVAVRALGRGEAAALGSRLEADRQALLEVADQGAGMTPEVRERLFEPFFTTKPRGQGTGLGLSTVHGIVAQSGGHVAVETAPGRGSAFRVFLPLATGAPPPGEAAPAAGPARARILLVEDDGHVLALARRVLERAGYRVSAAGSGAEALEALALGDAPALLLTDVAMPGLSGAELAARVRALRPGVRVLFMSGYFDADLAAGEVDPALLVQKPFAPEDLLRRVREALDGAPAA
jgi:CheY-like chemotaxis protein